MRYTTIIQDETFEIEIQQDGSVIINGKRHEIDLLSLSSSQFSIIADNRSMEVVVEEQDGNYEILLEGRLFEGRVLDERALLVARRTGGLGTNSGELTSPMPGLIVKVLVEPGQLVEKGDTVVILESMKMQNELKATKDGLVEQLKVDSNDIVEKGQLLLVIADE